MKLSEDTEDVKNLANWNNKAFGLISLTVCPVQFSGSHVCAHLCMCMHMKIWRAASLE